MKTETDSVSNILAKNSTSFFIPPFQRAYAWGRNEIERYFNDISKIIDSELDSKQSDKLEHFFGTVVIKQETKGFSTKSLIIDGQQRLTTTLIFLIALRDLEIDEKKKEYITNTYLINSSSTFEDKIKLKQVTSDWDSYKSLIKGEPPKPGIVKNAYELLKTKINKKKIINNKINTEHYIIAIQRMNLAVIFLDERHYKGEDPQIIFETLNSLGKPLTLADLIRNNILLNMDSNSQSKAYEEIWHPKIENIFKENTSKFFRDYLQYKTITVLKVVNDNNTKELYQYFKNFIETEFANKEDFINDIIRYVKLYKWIITEINNETISNNNQNDKEIKELLRNIFHDIKTEAFKPFVLGLLEYHQYTVKNIKISDETLILILKSIRTYLIRRRILGLTEGENKSIVPLIEKIQDLAEGRDSMFNILSKMIYKLRLPNDNEVKDKLRRINFYNDLKKYSKFILGKIEEYNSKVSVDFRSSKITVEHIMPQEITDNWKKDLGNNFNEIHKEYLHNIGNLILTEFNSEMGNKTFLEKKEKLKKSNLSYRNDIINRITWSKQDIIQHQENMINYFINTFDLPKEYKESYNWNTELNQKIEFSPLDIDACYIAEGNKPIEFRIFNDVIKVKNWQDIFIEFLKYFRDKQEDNFNFIINNQFELFEKGNNTIVTWSWFRELLDEKITLSDKYKTFEYKTWDKVKGLNEDTLFIHTNISSKYCITRIANIMNKFSMDESSVLIKIK